MTERNFGKKSWIVESNGTENRRQIKRNRYKAATKMCKHIE